MAVLASDSVRDTHIRLYAPFPPLLTSLKIAYIIQSPWRNDNKIIKGANINS